jgi:hypothetical protein
MDTDLPRVFVVMPFKKPFFDDLYELAIRGPCAKFRFPCVRADRIDEPGFVLEQIYDETIGADIIIADMTNRSPNVFYEVGFADALGKHVILLASSDEELTAFDTNHLRHHVYDGSVAKARRIITRLLGNYREHLLPGGHQIAGADCVWAWPGEEPKLTFLKPMPGKVDPKGGQSIDETRVGPILRARNTSRNWNHIPGWSIMYLFAGDPVKDLREGDVMVLAIEALATADCQLTLTFEGGEGLEKKWVIFGRTEYVLKRGGWRQYCLPAVTLGANNPGYPASKGIRVHVRTNTGSRRIEFRSIRLFRLPRHETTMPTVDA